MEEISRKVKQKIQKQKTGEKVKNKTKPGTQFRKSNI